MGSQPRTPDPIDDLAYLQELVRKLLDNTSLLDIVFPDIDDMERGVFDHSHTTMSSGRLGANESSTRAGEHSEPSQTAEFTVTATGIIFGLYLFSCFCVSLFFTFCASVH